MTAPSTNPLSSSVLNRAQQQNRIHPTPKGTESTIPQKAPDTISPSKNNIQTIKDLISSQEVADPNKILEGEKIAALSDAELSKELDALADILSLPAK